MPRFLALPLLCLAALALAQPCCSEWTQNHRAQRVIHGSQDVQSIIRCLRERGNHRIFLRFFWQSGFSTIIGRYVDTQPITLLVPTDDAFRALPSAIFLRIKGAEQIKLLEYLMLLHLLPADYLRAVLDSAFFDTVLGDSIYKRPSGDDGTIVLSSAENPRFQYQTAEVVQPDACLLSTPTVAGQVLNRVLIPPSLLDAT